MNITTETQIISFPSIEEIRETTAFLLNYDKSKAKTVFKLENSPITHPQQEQPLRTYCTKLYEINLYHDAQSDDKFYQKIEYILNKTISKESFYINFIFMRVNKDRTHTQIIIIAKDQYKIHDWKAEEHLAKITNQLYYYLRNPQKLISEQLKLLKTHNDRLTELADEANMVKSNISDICDNIAILNNLLTTADSLTKTSNEQAN